MCVIRTALPKDAGDLVNLIQAHAEYEKTEASCDEEALTAELKRHPASLILLIAESDGVAVGYASMTIDFSTWHCSRWAHLDCLFVSKHHRGKKIGLKLFSAVCGEARRQGLNRIEWQTPNWNKDAIRFYERTGAANSEKVRFIIPDLSRKTY